MTDVEFLGHHTPRLDEKGRLFLPARFREDLGDKIVITKGADRCLVVYPHEVFKVNVLDKLSAGPTASREIRQLRRALLGNASTEAPDRQGRITIPAPLRTYAGLDKECTVVGLGDYLEVWDTAAYEAAEAGVDGALDALDLGGIVPL